MGFWSEVQSTNLYKLLLKKRRERKVKICVKVRKKRVDVQSPIPLAFFAQYSPMFWAALVVVVVMMVRSLWNR